MREDGRVDGWYGGWRREDDSFVWEVGKGGVEVRRVGEKREDECRG